MWIECLLVWSAESLQIWSDLITSAFVSTQQLEGSGSMQLPPKGNLAIRCLMRQFWGQFKWCFLIGAVRQDWINLFHRLGEVYINVVSDPYTSKIFLVFWLANNATCPLIFFAHLVFSCKVCVMHVCCACCYIIKCVVIVYTRESEGTISKWGLCIKGRHTHENDILVNQQVYDDNQFCTNTPILFQLK